MRPRDGTAVRSVKMKEAANMKYILLIWAPKAGFDAHRNWFGKDVQGETVPRCNELP
jgi:hypothetical protein